MKYPVLAKPPVIPRSLRTSQPTYDVRKLLRQMADTDVDGAYQIVLSVIVQKFSDKEQVLQSRLRSPCIRQVSPSTSTLNSVSSSSRLSQAIAQVRHVEKWLYAEHSPVVMRNTSWRVRCALKRQNIPELAPLVAMLDKVREDMFPEALWT
eukprot:5064815-Amphidinium_carterae.1